MRQSIAPRVTTRKRRCVRTGAARRFYSSNSVFRPPEYRRHVRRRKGTDGAREAIAGEEFRSEFCYVSASSSVSLNKHGGTRFACSSRRFFRLTPGGLALRMATESSAALSSRHTRLASARRHRARAWRERSFASSTSAYLVALFPLES